MAQSRPGLQAGVQYHPENPAERRQFCKEMLGDCRYVSSRIKALSKTSTLPPLLGVIASLLFSILSSEGNAPKGNTANWISVPAQCFSLWEALAGHCSRAAGEESERNSSSAVFGGCFALLLTEEADCLWVFRPVLCKGPKCKDRQVPWCIRTVSCSAVWTLQSIPKPEWCTQWGQELCVSAGAAG